MTLSTMILTFDLPEAQSLKGRRKILNSIKEHLKSLNVSLLDLSSEYPKEATLAVAFLSPDEKHAAQYRTRIEELIERRFPELACEYEYETL